MTDPIRTIDEAIRDADKLSKTLAKKNGRQVQSQDERSLIRAIAETWYRTHRPILQTFDAGNELETCNRAFSTLLEMSERHTARTQYVQHLKSVKGSLVALRSQLLTSPAPQSDPAQGRASPPDFSSLVGDPKMQAILRRRWEETVVCMGAGAHLAATIMMGGLLEALFLARINRLKNKASVFKAKAAPKDHKTGNTLPLSDWTLHNYIDVAHELDWIRQTAKDLSVVLRDYRNYVHPAKELSHGITIGEHDTPLMWAVFTRVTDQVLRIV